MNPTQQAEKYLTAIKRRVNLTGIVAEAVEAGGKPRITMLSVHGDLLNITVDLEKKVYCIDYSLGEERMDGEIEEQQELLYLVELWAAQVVRDESITPKRRTEESRETLAETHRPTYWERKNWHVVVLDVCPHCHGVGDYIRHGHNFGDCYQCHTEGCWTGMDTFYQRLYHGARYVAHHVQGYPYQTDEAAAEDFGEETAAEFTEDFTRQLVLDALWD